MMTRSTWTIALLPLLVLILPARAAAELLPDPHIGFLNGDARVQRFDSAGAILAGRIVEKEVLGAAHGATR